MSNFYSFYPPSGGGSNASVGVNGAPAPSSSTEVAGQDPSGNLSPLQTDLSGNLLVSIDPSTQPFHVIVDSSALPTGAATSANQATEIASLASIDSKLTSPLAVTGPLTDVQLRASAVPVSAAALPLPSGAATSANQATQITSLTSIDGKLGSLGQKTMAGSAPVVIASDQSAITVTGTVTATNPSVSATGSAVPASATFVGGSDGTNLRALSVDSTGKLNVNNISGTVSLPTGASTETTLSAINAKLGSLGQKAMAGSAPVVIASDQSAIPVTLTSTTITGTVAATQSGTWNITNISGTVSLPTGASTETTLSALNGKFGSLGQKTMSGSAPVTIASDQSALGVAQAGKSKANAPVRNDYSSVNVTTAAYVQLVASTTSATTEIEIFDSSGQTLTLAVGGAGSEVNQINIFPGGNGRVPLLIPAGSRVSIKALSATASVGEIDLNFYS